MSFNSLQFILLLVIVILTYWRLRLKGQNRLLLLASYLFYGWWDWRFLLLLVITTVVDFAIGIRIEESPEERGKKAWLVSQLTFNLGILAFFKYANFFVDSAQHVATALGLGWSAPVLHIILPVGISFFVFHEISYAVDIYRGRLEAERNLGTYALFIAYWSLYASSICHAAFLATPYGALVSSGYPFHRLSSVKGTGVNFGYAQIVPTWTKVPPRSIRPSRRACSIRCMAMAMLA